LRLSGKACRNDTGSVQTTLMPQEGPRAHTQVTPVELAVHTWLDPVLDEPEVKIPNLRAEGVTGIEARPWAGAGYRQQLREVGALLRDALLTLKAGESPPERAAANAGISCFSAVGGTRCACP